MNVFYRLKNSIETIAESCWHKLSPEHKEKFETVNADTDGVVSASHQVCEKNGEVHLAHSTDTTVASVNMTALAGSL